MKPFQRFTLFCLLTVILVSCSGNLTLVADTTDLNTITTTVEPTTTKTLTPTPTLTLTPTPTSTPIGGSLPLVAYSSYSDQTQKNRQLNIARLGEESLLATLPLNMLYFPGAIRFSPDGTMLAFFNGKAEEKGIYLYDMVSGELNFIIGIADNEQLDDLAWSPDQNYLMYSVFTGWPPRYWIYDIQAKSKKYAGTGYIGQWGQKSNQLFYNTTSGGWNKIDPKTLNSERVDLPRNSKSKLSKELKLSSWGFRYLPALESVYLDGVISEDRSNVYALASADLEDEIVFANFDEHEKLRKVIPSPNGKNYLLISQKSLYDENEQHLGSEMYTYLVDIEKLPLSEELKPLPMVAFQWAPDSSVFLAYQLDRSKAGVVPTLDKILAIDIKTLATIAEYRLIDGMGQPALVPIIDSDSRLFGIDVYWP